jgi:hypothetical protein
VRRASLGRPTLSLLALASCGEARTFKVLPTGSLQTHYLIDYQHTSDSATLFSTMGHLVVFNPGAADARLEVTAFYENREPDRFNLVARAGSSTESSSDHWPIHGGGRFALEVTSDRPVICQATIGWTNTGSRYGWGAETRSPKGPREAAKSYGSITSLARSWYYADGLVLQDGVSHALGRDGDKPHSLWIRESESAIMLNPSDQPAEATLTLHYGQEAQVHVVVIPPRRLKSVSMDAIARPNRGYGVTVTSDREIAVQWLRQVNWHDSEETMAFWSVPAVPLETGAPAPR